MTLKPIAQCKKDLDFAPARAWSTVLPPICWRGQLLCGFAHEGEALDLSERHFIELWKACHPELGLGEFSRFISLLAREWEDLSVELREGLAGLYGWRWNERFEQTLQILARTPLTFQRFVDAKKMSARDLSPLLAVKDPAGMRPFLEALTGLQISRFEAGRALELFVELFLMDRPLNDLLPTCDNGGLYLRRLERWRRPEASIQDEEWRGKVNQWPWPAQVQAEWQRFGDQAGLEIKIRTTSPEDFQKKLERLATIPDTWQCKS